MIKVLVVAKTSEKYLFQGIDEYLKRIQHFHKINYFEIPSIKNSKNLSELEQKVKEGEIILKEIKENDHLILLDENGKEFSSLQMAEKLEKKLAGFKTIVFVVAGPYGFSEEVVKRSAEKWSLSKLTFSHQMVRLFFLEQIYRSFSILKGMPYHHR
jgi:23S rRNA (pseudouridine1915-N3)-methyltransferase